MLADGEQCLRMSSVSLGMSSTRRRHGFSEYHNARAKGRNTSSSLVPFPLSPFQLGRLCSTFLLCFYPDRHRIQIPSHPSSPLLQVDLHTSRRRLRLTISLCSTQTNTGSKFRLIPPSSSGRALRAVAFSPQSMFPQTDTGSKFRLIPLLSSPLLPRHYTARPLHQSP